MPLLAVSGPALWAIVFAAAVGAALSLGFARQWLGPVFFYETRRTARKPRFFISRIAYAVWLFVLLLWVYAAWGRGVHSAAETARPDALAELAAAFFAAYSVTQFVVALLLTPVVIGSSIAEEKDRRTIEF